MSSSAAWIIVVAIGLTSLAPDPSPIQNKLASASQKKPSQGTLEQVASRRLVLRGQILEWKAPQLFVFKAGGKTLEVLALDMTSGPLDGLGMGTHYYRHETEKLGELKAGTQLTAYATLEEEGDTEQLGGLVLLAAGDLEPPALSQFDLDRSKPRWYRGPLTFAGDDHDKAYLDGKQLLAPVSRKVTVVRKVSAADFRAIKKPTVVLVVSESQEPGKAPTYGAIRIILPPRKPVAKKEYSLIIEPEKLEEAAEKDDDKKQ